MNSIQQQVPATEHSSSQGQAPYAPYPKVRPQRLHSWFNLVPVAEFEKKAAQKILFMDTFVTITASAGEGGQCYKVLFEGERPMVHVVHLGLIFAWYGSDLGRPDRPFPTLYESAYPTRYVTSVPVVFDNTHVMDFVENGSDNLHFRHVHLWEYSKIYNHQVTEDIITLEHDTRIHYGRCSFNPFIRFMSYLLPELELHHDYAYHGPGIAVVNAEGKGAPESHSVVTLTPEGPDRTRVYVTIAMPETTFPIWAEKIYQTLFRNKKLCETAAGVMANYIKNEFDVDAVIWKNRRVTHRYNLLRSEQHLQNVIDWGKTFYPEDFEMPPEPSPRYESELQWHALDDARNIKQGKIKSYTVMGEELIAYRDSSENIHVREAHCPHQGAHLGVQGKIEDDCIRCPFHGFYFDTQGKCRGSNLNNTQKTLPGLEMNLIKTREVGAGIEVLI